MEYRPLDITVVSADNIKNVNLMSKMDVYAAISIGGDCHTTPVHNGAGKSPKWNHCLTFFVYESVIKSSNLYVIFKIMSRRILGDKEIGQVSVPVKDLLDRGDGGRRVVEYQIRTVSGKMKGTLKFSYKFGEVISPPVPAAPPPVAVASKASGEPVMAYPPPQAAGYPPPPYGQPHGYPLQQPGYGYPPQQAYGGGNGAPTYGGGYGAVPPKKKKKGMGGLGLGLGAGLLGGLLVGDMISDVGSYDAGYDAGFDDGGGFDF